MQRVQIVESVQYRPFGGQLSNTGTTSSMTYTDDLWNGGDDLPELGVVVLGARLYDPVLQRFLQRDPIVIAGGASRGNPYAFSFNDPVNYADPDGLYPGCGSLCIGTTHSVELATTAYSVALVVGGLIPGLELLGFDVGTPSAPRANALQVNVPAQIIQVEQEEGFGGYAEWYGKSALSMHPAMLPFTVWGAISDAWSDGGAIGVLDLFVPDELPGTVASAVQSCINGNYGGCARKLHAATIEAGSLALAAAKGFLALRGPRAAATIELEASAAGGGARGGAARGAGEVTAAEIRAINRSLGGTTELAGNAETVIANMAYREGATAKAATAIRDIAGRHLFDDANKRTAQAVAERLLGSGANPSQIRSVIDQVATGGLRTVEDIAAALGP